MECNRCNGVMVQEIFEDLDTGCAGFPGWRCVICGDILDAVIMENRATRPSPMGDRARRRHFTIPS